MKNRWARKTVEEEEDDDDENYSWFLNLLFASISCNFFNSKTLLIASTRAYHYIRSIGLLLHSFVYVLQHSYEVRTLWTLLSSWTWWNTVKKVQ